MLQLIDLLHCSYWVNRPWWPRVRSHRGMSSRW